MLKSSIPLAALALALTGCDSVSRSFAPVPTPPAPAQNAKSSYNPGPTFPGPLSEVYVIPWPTNCTGTRLITGYGTHYAPFSGDLDAIKQRLPDHCRVRLSGGIYWSGASWGLNAKAGQSWSGAGIGITIIRRDPAFSLPRDQTLFWSYEDGITIEDMTLDANGQPGDVWQRNGLDLFGSQNTVRRVEVINATGSWTNHAECFPIFVGWSNYTRGNLISECRVSRPRGDYITGISLNGGGIVEKCVVDLPAAYGNCSFQGSCINGAVFTLNTALGGFYGYYSDWGSDTNLTLTWNDFSRSQQAIVIQKGSTNWVTKGFLSIGNRGAADQQ